MFLASPPRVAFDASKHPHRLGRWLRVGIGAVASWALASSDVSATTLQARYTFDAARVNVQTLDDGHAVVGVAPTAEATNLKTFNAGQPQLDYETVTFLVPRGSRLTALRARSVDVSPVQVSAPLAMAAPVLDDAGFAHQPPPVQVPHLDPGNVEFDASRYPVIVAEAAGEGALHGYQLLSVRVYPLRWERARSTLWVARQVEIEIDVEPGAPLPIERGRYRADLEAAAKQAVASIVVNPDAIEGYSRRIGAQVDARRAGFHPTEAPSLEGSPVDYVIVTAPQLAAAWQPFADWKTRRGVPTVIRTTDWITANYRNGSDLQETIRTFVRDAYTKWGVRWVLLGGDSDHLPARYAFSAQGEGENRSIPTDMYFACLDGNWNADGDAVYGEAASDFSQPRDSTDMYAEVYVGRAPVTTVAEVERFVGKVIEYEDPADLTYQEGHVFLGEVLLPSSWSPPTPPSLDGAVYSEQVRALGGSCIESFRLYENHTAFSGSLPLTRAGAIGAMNAGPGFVNHIGHGFRYNMSCGDASVVNADASALANGDRRFVLYMLNCTATAFDFPCLAEAFLKAPGGAVAVLGSTRSAFAVQAANYNREFFEAAYVNQHRHLGEAFVYSRLPYTPSAYFDTLDRYSHFLYNFLGDPEMILNTCALATTTVTHAAAIPLGEIDVDVHVESNGQPLANALVCLSRDGVTGSGSDGYAFASTDANGDAHLVFRAESAGTATLTVSGRNTTMHRSTITLESAGAPYLHVPRHTLRDGGAAPAAGNGDGILDAGETVVLDVTIVNDGGGAATTTPAVLQIASPWVSGVDSVFTVADLAPGDSTTAAAAVAFTLSPATPDGTVLPLQFALGSLPLAWQDTARRIVHAPRLELALLDVIDAPPGGNGDGVVQPGETFDLVPVLKNYGTGTADGLWARLDSDDLDITIEVDSVAIGVAAPQQEASPLSGFRLSEATADFNRLQLLVRDGYGRQTSWSVTLRPPVTPATPLLSSRTSPTAVAVTWPPSADPDLAGYHVYRAPSVSGPWSRVTVDRTIATAYYQDTGLAPSTSYAYRVTAVDSAGNESTPSAASTISTNPGQLAGWPIVMAGSTVCPVAIGDLDGDGAREIVVGDEHPYAWHANGVEVLDGDGDPQTWGVLSTAMNAISSAPSMAELDGQPGLEVFFTAWTDSNKACVLRGDGTPLAGWPRNPGPFPAQRGFWGSTAAVDIDGDGIAELFAPARNGNLYAWRANGTPLGATPVFKSGFGIDIRTSPGFANLDADPQLEIVFATPSGRLEVWNHDGTSVPGYPIQAGISCYANTAIGDVNHDGTLDIVMLTDGGFVHVFDSATATQLSGWPRALNIKASPISPSPALADFEQDGFLEIVVANNGGTNATLSSVRVFDHQGNVRPGWPRSVGDVNSESSPIVADFSGDGVPDIVFGNESGYLYGWNHQGVSLPGFPITVGDFIRATPFADDVDADGSIDLVLAGWDKTLYVWDLPVAWAPAAAQWPTLKHDVHRSGAWGFSSDTAPPALPSVLGSTSHLASTWSNDPTVEIHWSGAHDPSGIGGYSYAWDTNPSTLPDTIIDGTATSTTSPALVDGVEHWFHLRVVDALGHWTTTAAHFGPIRIDTVAPVNGTAIASAQLRSLWLSERIVELVWALGNDGESPPGHTPPAPPRTPPEWSSLEGGPDATMAVVQSGVAGYSVAWDTNPTTVPDVSVETTVAPHSSPPLADGNAHWAHVRTIDHAGNGAAAATTLHWGPFWIDGSPPSLPQSVTLQPTPGTWVSATSIQAQWVASVDLHSGLAGHAMVFDAQPATEIPATPNSQVPFLEPAPEGETWFHLRAFDRVGNFSATVHAGPVRIDRTAPQVTLVAANGGEVLYPGDPFVIRWQSSDAHSGVQGYSLAYSTDGGATFPHDIHAAASGDSIYEWVVPPDTTLHARIRVTVHDAAGNTATDMSNSDFTIAPVATNRHEQPVEYTGIEEATPNPFNPTTTLSWSLLESGRVRLAIYDARGRRVRLLVDEVFPANVRRTTTWDGRDDGGSGLPSGVYFARFEAPGTRRALRLLLVK